MKNNNGNSINEIRVLAETASKHNLVLIDFRLFNIIFTAFGVGFTLGDDGTMKPMNMPPQLAVILKLEGYDNE